MRKLVLVLLVTVCWVGVSWGSCELGPKTLMAIEDMVEDAVTGVGDVVCPAIPGCSCPAAPDCLCPGGGIGLEGLDVEPELVQCSSCRVHDAKTHCRRCLVRFGVE